MASQFATSLPRERKLASRFHTACEKRATSEEDWTHIDGTTSFRRTAEIVLKAGLIFMFRGEVPYVPELILSEESSEEDEDAPVGGARKNVEDRGAAAARLRVTSKGKEGITQ